MTDAEKVERLTAILASIAPDQVPGPFICGKLGKAGSDGLHEAYMICPTYGADHQTTAIYKRQK